MMTMRARTRLVATATVLALPALVLMGCSSDSPGATRATQGFAPMEAAEGAIRLGTGQPGDEVGGDDGAVQDAAEILALEKEWAENQKPLGDASWLAESRYPDDYAFSYFEKDAPGMVIGFRGAAPAEVRAAFEATGLPYSIEEYVGFTSADVQVVVQSVVQQLATTDPTLQFAVGGAPDRGHRVIQVTAFTENDDAAAALFARVEGLDVPEGFTVVTDRQNSEITPLSASAVQGF